jgi:hypothetical protein
MDVQTLFSFGYEKAVLDVEEEFMQAAASVEQTKGRMLWAGETYILGKANCDPSFPECIMNMPANPPVLKPHISLEANKERTEQVLKDLGRPLHWPMNDTKLEELIETRFVVGLAEAIKGAMSSEDASFTLRPRIRYIVTVTVRIDPVYRAMSRFGPALELNRWNFYVQSVSVEEMKMDYSRRSKGAVRVMFKISESSTRQREKYPYDVNEFMTSVGAWTGIWAIGLGLLNKWQKYSLPCGFATAGEASGYLEPKFDKLKQKRKNNVERVFKYMLPFCKCCCGLRRKTRVAAYEPDSCIGA